MPYPWMIREGAPTEHLSTFEVVAGLLGSYEVAKALLLKAGGLRGVREMSDDEMLDVPGMGVARVRRLRMAFSLSSRLSVLPPKPFERITSPQRAASLFMEDLRYKKREHFMILLLNTKNHVLSREEISVGSLNASIVHPREIFKIPLQKSAASIILVHNHPSGDPSPSHEDVSVTRRLVDAGKLLGVAVCDHIIIGDGCYFSFKEKGLL